MSREIMRKSCIPIIPKSLQYLTQEIPANPLPSKVHKPQKQCDDKTCSHKQHHNDHKDEHYANHNNRSSRNYTGKECDFQHARSSTVHDHHHHDDDDERNRRKSRYHLKCEDSEHSYESNLKRRPGRISFDSIIDLNYTNARGCTTFNHSEKCKKSGGLKCDLLDKWRCRKSECMANKNNPKRQSRCSKHLTKCEICDEYASALRELERNQSHSRFDSFYNNYNIDWHPKSSVTYPAECKNEERLMECP